jgi:NAD(P)-dependent dehydrogenase (short-subunit alcohol dehydrogenase family)
MSARGSPTYDFEQNVVLVTGAARGLGRSHALAYADHGATVVALDIAGDREHVPYDLSTREQLDTVIEDIEADGGEALAVEADVSVEAEVKAAVETAIKEFGRIDVLANNAGIGTILPALDITTDQWNDVLDTNLKGTWLCAKHVGQHFTEREGGGVVVNTSSATGLVGQPGFAHYSASKHGVIGLTKTLALELAEHDVTVNAVCPTAVETPLIPKVTEVFGSEQMEEVGRLAGPASILGDEDEQSIPPEAVSEAFLWLSSDAARYVTGSVLAVDAGFTSK